MKLLLGKSMKRRKILWTITSVLSLVSAGPATTQPSSETVTVPGNGGAVDADHPGTGVGSAPFGVPGGHGRGTTRPAGGPASRPARPRAMEAVFQSGYDAARLGEIGDDSFLSLSEDQRKAWDGAFKAAANASEALKTKYAAELPAIDREVARLQAAHGQADPQAFVRLMTNHEAYFVDFAKTTHDFRMSLVAILKPEQLRKWDRIGVRAALAGRAKEDQTSGVSQKALDAACDSAVDQIEKLPEPRDPAEVDRILERAWDDCGKTGGP